VRGSSSEASVRSDQRFALAEEGQLEPVGVFRPEFAEYVPAGIVRKRKTKTLGGPAEAGTRTATIPAE